MVFPTVENAFDGGERNGARLQERGMTHASRHGPCWNG